MPEKQILTSTLQIPANVEIIQHWVVIAKIIGPLLAIILSLVVWAWRRMEKTQEKLETTFIAHVKENDEVHDQLFTLQREADHKLDNLLGEHKGNTQKRGCQSDS